MNGGVIAGAARLGFGMDEAPTPRASAGSLLRLDLNVQLPDAAVSAESVREQLRLLARLGYDGAAVARPIARRLTRKDVSSVSITSFWPLGPPNRSLEKTAAGSVSSWPARPAT